MKKKYNLILISLIILAAVMGVMVSNMNEVNAEDNSAAVCEDYMKTTYIDKISVKINGNNVTLNNGSIQDLYYTVNNNGEKVLLNRNSEVTIQIDETAAIYFYLVKQDGTCQVEDINNNIGYITVNAGPVENPLYNSDICINYRGKYSGNKTMKQAIPYCFSKNVDKVYDYQTVANWINAAESAYNGANQQTTIQKGENNVDDVSKTQKLTCDAFSTNNYETMRKYSHVETKTENSCEETCREDIEVNFSDPIATQAGMCFQYLIEIKSKVVCESKYKAPLPTAKPVCVPYAVCTSGGKSFEVGGPNEEFDSCVKKCDNGKYTQKCINKCYDEVYETKKTTKTSDIRNLKTTQNTFMDSIRKTYTTDAKGCIIANTVDYNNDAEIRALYEQQQRHVGGSYVTENGVVRWVPNSTGCNTDIGHYYFKSIERTKTTVRMLRGDLGYSTDTEYYTPDDNGILRAIHTNGTECGDSCSWISECSEDTSLTETYTFNGNTYLTFEEAMAAYNAAKSTCESKSASCSNETTEYKMVVENLDENDDRNDDDKEDFTETFTANQKLNNKEISGKFKSMVIYAGGTCELNKGSCEAKDQVATNPSPTNCWNYHNIITFPGTWINNKTGQLVHSIQKGKEDYFTYIGNEYCTKLDSQSVNKAWYNWKVNQSNNLTKEKIEEDIEYNITGDIKNYGYFGWNFDIKCFYGLIKNPEECTTSKCDVSKKSDTKANNGVNDYKFRAISLDNMFPSDENGQVSRQAGFNWNCNGTNLENENYIVEPEALTNEIEKLGDSIYNDDKYLDYSIHLTPETMRKIRTEYNDTYENYEYTNTTGNVGNQKTAGITVYKSQMLTNLGSSVVKKRGLIGCNNETNGQCDKTVSTNNSCYNLYQAESTVLKGGN